MQFYNIAIISVNILRKLACSNNGGWRTEKLETTLDRNYAYFGDRCSTS